MSLEPIAPNSNRSALPNHDTLMELAVATSDYLEAESRLRKVHIGHFGYEVLKAAADKVLDVLVSIDEDPSLKGIDLKANWQAFQEISEILFLKMCDAMEIEDAPAFGQVPALSGITREALKEALATARSEAERLLLSVPPPPFLERPIGGFLTASSLPVVVYEIQDVSPRLSLDQKFHLGGRYLIGIINDTKIGVWDILGRSLYPGKGHLRLTQKEDDHGLNTTFSDLFPTAKGTFKPFIQHSQLFMAVRTNATIESIEGTLESHRFLCFVEPRDDGVIINFCEYTTLDPRTLYADGKEIEKVGAAIAALSR